MSTRGQRILLTGIHGTRPDVYVDDLVKVLNGQDGLPAQHIYGYTNTRQYHSGGVFVNTLDSEITLSSMLQRAAAQADNLEVARREHELQLPHHLLMCCDFGAHYLHRLYAQGASNALLAAAVHVQRTALKAFAPAVVLHLTSGRSRKSDDDYFATMFAICPSLHRIEAMKPSVQHPGMYWAVLSRLMGAINSEWPQSG